MSQQDLFTLIALAGPVVTFLAGLVSHLIFARMTPQQHQMVSDVASMVVPAVEQTSNLLSGEGKRQEAVRMISEILISLGAKNVNSSLISAAIEATVFAMNQAKMNSATVKLPAIKTIDQK